MSSLLPANATPQERSIEASIERAGAVPVIIRENYNPDTCPADLLPWLAWTFSVDDWSPAWSDEQKRNTIKSAFAVQRIKGTKGAVKGALSSLGYSVQAQEWFTQDPVGEPYTFRLILDTSQVPIDEAALAKLFEVVNTTKNLRSHLSAVVPGVTSVAGPVVAAAATMGSEITVDFVGSLLLDGSWMLDGTYNLNSLKVPA